MSNAAHHLVESGPNNESDDHRIWGLVAPARFFAGKYTVSSAHIDPNDTADPHCLQWLYLGFPIGAALPFAAYWLHKRYPDKMYDKIIWPIVLDGGQTVPQA